jgi:peptide/nickel transport system permease protein
MAQHKTIYILKRLLLALPTLLLISLLTFGLSRCSPDDPVQRYFGDNLATTFDPEVRSLQYAEQAATLGVDKPAFYLTLTTAAFPDTLHRIFPPLRREKMVRMAWQTGNWPATQACEKALAAVVRAVERLPNTLPHLPPMRQILDALLNESDPARLGVLTASLAGQWNQLPNEYVKSTISDVENWQKALHHWQNTPKRNLLYQPALYWYGLDNQYHQWLFGLFSRNMGVSLSSRQPIWRDLQPRLVVTLVINGIALLLALLIALSTGIFLARRTGTATDRWGRRSLAFLSALPVFWIGSLLVLAFATPDGGLFLIPGLSLSQYAPDSMSIWAWLGDNALKIILPVVTIALHHIALLALQTRSGILDTRNADYVRTARAKGLSEKRVFWRHILPSAAFPVIGTVARSVPALLSGALVVEYLFNFPGMGLKTQEAFAARDYPVLFAIVLIGAVLTIISNLIADWLYAALDPRVEY